MDLDSIDYGFFVISYQGTKANPMPAFVVLLVLQPLWLLVVLALASGLVTGFLDPAYCRALTFV